MSDTSTGHNCLQDFTVTSEKYSSKNDLGISTPTLIPQTTQLLGKHKAEFQIILQGQFFFLPHFQLI